MVGWFLFSMVGSQGERATACWDYITLPGQPRTVPWAAKEWDKL